MLRKPQPAGPARPMPPAEFDEVHFDMRFAVAADLPEWTHATFLEEGAGLHNPDHSHLIDADIGFLWASSGYVKQGRQVLGLTEDTTAGVRGNAWQQGRAEQQLREWFGHVPRFLITLDATYCAQCTDAEFCALVEHELYHCGHKRDEFGQPAFDKHGRPKLGIRGHDVEEFVGIVERYGVGDADSNLARLIIAAAKGGTVAPIRIAQACGTCLLRVA